MCGIAGIINCHNDAIDVSQLVRMTEIIKHRGPDDHGMVFFHPINGCGQAAVMECKNYATAEDSGGKYSCGFGHVRLSIIDLSERGHQPMSNRDGSLWIIYNGEIYNYIEIRSVLIARGHEFRTDTDTEVILYAYKEWGPDCLQRFNGMWSFAIYDQRQNKVFCARDRFGIKPFYYVATDSAFAFGSEIRQLLPFLNRVHANLKIVEEFIFAGTTEHPKNTFFNGIFKLPGGHHLTYNLGTHSYVIERYYDLATNSNMEKMRMDEAVRLYGALLSEAVLLRLRSDVSVGTCLSGGLDSSSIATLAAEPYKQATGEAFRAVTAVSEFKMNDESDFAELVANHSSMKWLTVKPTYGDFAENLNEVVRAQEEPFGSPSICMQFFVMKTARENGIPVLLDGQGGDETLLGYERYYIGHFLNLMERCGIRFAVRSLFDCWKNNTKMSPLKIFQYLVYFSSAKLRYWNYCYRNRYLRRYPDLPEVMQLNAAAIRDIQRLQKLEIERSNIPHLLRFEDKNSMWHSIETRLPFLDYRVVQSAFSLPGPTKIRHGWTKYVLRRFMADKMPAEIIWRKNKFGFEAPDRIWLSRHAPIMHKEVSSSKILTVLCKPGVLEKKFLSLDIETRWRLFSVAVWEKEFAVET